MGAVQKELSYGSVLDTMKIKCFFEINKIKLLDVWEGSDLRALYYILLVLSLYLLLLVLTVLLETYKSKGTLRPDDVLATLSDGCCRKPKKESMRTRYEKIRPIPRMSQESTSTVTVSLILTENERSRTSMEGDRQGDSWAKD